MIIFTGIGNLTRDPQISAISQTQMAVAKFTIAINRRDKNGEQKADFIPCVAFGKTAEYIDKYVHKGNKVAVTCSVRTGSYEKDGRTVYTTDFYVDHIENLTPKDASRPAEEKQESIPGFTELDEEIPF